MLNHSARVIFNTIVRSVLACSILIIGAALALAQQSLPTAADHTDPARIRFEETNRREMQLRKPADPTTKTSDPKRMEAIKAQIAQDFERILTLHNEMVHVIHADRPLDYQLIADATAEIKKRASRLQTTLALNKPESNAANQEKLPAAEPDVKAALVRLCRQIESFVKNPVIETPGTVNLPQLEKAGRDLESVIELGDRVQKIAQRLKKASR